MGRRIRVAPPRAQAAAGVTPPVEFDSYFDKAVKYIPADIVAAWVAVTGLVSSARDVPRQTILWVAFGIGLTFAQLVSETTSRLPRDATLVAVLPDVPEETAIALGGLRRAGRAITVVLIQHEENALETSYGRLIAEGIRDIRHLNSEEEVPELCRKQVDRSAPYSLA